MQRRTHPWRVRAERSSGSAALVSLVGNPSFVARWSQRGQIVDAPPNIDHRTPTLRRLLPGEGRVLFEHEPAVVPVAVELLDHLLDRGVAVAERAEQPAPGCF